MKDRIMKVFWLLIFIVFFPLASSANEQMGKKKDKAFLEIFACKSPEKLSRVPTIRSYWSTDMKFNWKEDGQFLLPTKVNFVKGSAWFARFTFHIITYEPGWHAFIVNTYEGSKAVMVGWIRVICGVCAIIFGIVFIFVGPFLAE